jgi:hypothetical protein
MSVDTWFIHGSRSDGRRCDRGFPPRPARREDGSELVFGVAGLAATVAAYDPAVHEAPIVVGHPAHDQPAYGWVKGLRIEDGGPVAELGDVDPDFADLVRARRYAMVSASFYRPDAPANPRPGIWSLRHVGSLGDAAGGQGPEAREFRRRPGGRDRVLRQPNN